ncbi:Fe(3+)-dicitrate ABC transporter ATP-binding protein [Corynebacterium sp. 13CS0277]|uniref:ABC transporter ATP-binding protein n=1 Tax=Corynebacterium sp. 13CS0277 TaxID=2071994 RepID=UPI000D02F056|nr:ABC transporter ATP-binding protein [Corynebacterium sp. 13CS0277]PRQ10824.1 Fe(3+)-dicitrate ABC transporter ATP-binding protein [Corynebacterium sp. 13CS0277]
MSTHPTIGARNITVGYGDREILHDISVELPEGEFTVIVGPNACGKSTLLKALCRMLPPTRGEVQLDGVNIHKQPPKEVAKKLSLLPQSPIAPDDITVYDLVSRGRYPHQSAFQHWSAADEEAVQRALLQARVVELADRRVSELSGGQRQRVWIALVLAQDTPIVFLDEPTTYLDITHQVEVLNLARALQRSGRTVVAVLHELTLAFRYATHLIMMKDGRIVAEGAVEDVVTSELLKEVYALDCDIVPDPRTGRPIVIPRDDEDWTLPGTATPETAAVAAPVADAADTVDTMVFDAVRD